MAVRGSAPLVSICPSLFAICLGVALNLACGHGARTAAPVDAESAGDGVVPADALAADTAPTAADAAPTSADTAAADAGTAGKDAGSGTCTPAQLQALEAEMAQALDAAAVDKAITTDPNFTLMLERKDGHQFVHSHGKSTPTTVYESASTSKWVTAAVILDLVDQGKLTLDSTAHDAMPQVWTETSVKLRHLLSFTSGFSDEPVCTNLGGSDFKSCVKDIYTKNAAKHAAPGAEFYYSSTHLQVAGFMAMRATSLTATWADVFDAFRKKTGLFPTATYDLPSATNPRLAGGMHWKAVEYMDFLRALFKGQVLKPATRAAMFANQRGTATVANSPALEGVQEDWAYGFGNWLECPTAKAAGTFDCGAGHRNACPGAYGAYPFLDFDDAYFGILARQGGTGTFPEGLRTFRVIQAKAGQWARNECGP